MIDSYGAGKPAREYFHTTTMIFQPSAGGTTPPAAAPAVATRAGFKLRGQSSATFEKTPYRLEFHDVLRAPNSADPTTGCARYIDVGSFIDHMIVNELGRGMDAYVRSEHFYKDRDGKVFAGPLWDFDLTFGVGGYFQNDQTSGWQYQQTRQPSANDCSTPRSATSSAGPPSRRSTSARSSPRPRPPGRVRCGS